MIIAEYPIKSIHALADFGLWELQAEFKKKIQLYNIY